MRDRSWAGVTASMVTSTPLYGVVGRQPTLASVQALLPRALNNSETVVGYGFFGTPTVGALLWKGGAITYLGRGIAWTDAGIIGLGGLPGTTESIATAINDAGQAVGYSYVEGVNSYATEWSAGQIINLGGLLGSTFSYAFGINDAGQVAKGSPRTLDAVSHPIAQALATIPANECANYLSGAGYASA